MSDCKQCGNLIVGRRRTAIFCSINCEQKAKRARRKAEDKAEGDLERELREGKP